MKLIIHLYTSNNPIYIQHRLHNPILINKIDILIIDSKVLVLIPYPDAYNIFGFAIICKALNLLHC